jgi:hypothetical protein
MKLIPENRLFPSPGTGFEFYEFNSEAGAISSPSYDIINTIKATKPLRVLSDAFIESV